VPTVGDEGDLVDSALKVAAAPAIDPVADIVLRRTGRSGV
jgi:hypothetical protein